MALTSDIHDIAEVFFIANLSAFISPRPASTTPVPIPAIIKVPTLNNLGTIQFPSDIRQIIEVLILEQSGT